MKTLHELKLEHANTTTHGELDDYIYQYFVNYCQERKKEYQSLYNDYSNHDQEIRNLRYTASHTDAYVGELHNLIKSDSVYTLLRYGSKSPSSSGVDDCEDYFYIDLYNLSTALRKADSDAATKTILE